MGKIQLLDNMTIQKIAAGEVIERPASIIKELVENSLDANSNNIVVEINEGGKTYIRVTDDGDGIEEEDLPLAFCRHSTSKLKKIDDLYSILTLGFRGEALASISAVARVEVLTKTKNSQAGIHALIEDGEIKSMDLVGSPKGTTMIIRDLFYNLPVRKKFLKSDLAEGNHISNMFYKLALGNYNSSFKLIRDDKVVLKTSGNGDIKENIYSILGKDITKGLIPIDFQYEEMNIKGYISNNNLYRSNRSHQYLYINGRYIVNYGISSAIEHHYKSLIPLNRYPVFMIYIDMDPSNLDVNIHPTKQEVKFTNKDNIIGIISNAVKDSLYPNVNIPTFQIRQEKRVEKEELPNLFEMADNKEASLVIRDYSKIDLSKGEDNNTSTNNIYDKVSSYKNDFIMEENKIEANDKFLNESIDDAVETVLEEMPLKKELPLIIPIGVLFNTYILGENKVDEKLYFIDQHAAHERIMYERYRKEYAKEAINIQQLMAPEIIELTNAEYNYLSTNLDYFKKMGFELEKFGPSSYAIRGVPFLFGKPNIRALFMDLLDNLDKDIKNSFETRIDKLMKLACSSAIKAGDKISFVEIKGLLKDLVECENPYSCPHGRPTIMEMTKKEIEKQFLRII